MGQIESQNSSSAVVNARYSAISALKRTYLRIGKVVPAKNPACISVLMASLIPSISHAAIQAHDFSTPAALSVEIIEPSWSHEGPPGKHVFNYKVVKAKNLYLNKQLMANGKISVT